MGYTVTVSTAATLLYTLAISYAGLTPLRQSLQTSELSDCNAAPPWGRPALISNAKVRMHLKTQQSITISLPNHIWDGFSRFFMFPFVILNRFWIANSENGVGFWFFIIKCGLKIIERVKARAFSDARHWEMATEVMEVGYMLFVPNTWHILFWVIWLVCVNS